jgi:hypothetical protein
LGSHGPKDTFGNAEKIMNAKYRYTSDYTIVQNHIDAYKFAIQTRSGLKNV